MGASLRNRAEEVTEDLVNEFPQVQGVCLFGSVARGDSDARSDIDLFVVGEDPKLTPSTIRRRLHLRNAQPKVSIVYHTPRTLDRYVRTGSRFLVHLQLEGKVLYDVSGKLREIQRQPPLSASIRPEVEGQLKRLKIYEDPARFNGNFLFPLAHIFAIGKAIVMAILAENEIYEFNRDAALDEFTNRFPAAREDIDTLRRLAPFSLLVSRGVEQELPFPYYDSDEEVAEAIGTIRRLSKYAAYA